jgi:hypothetical protein
MSAVAAALPAVPRPDSLRSIDELDAAICRLASRIHSETYQMLVLVREFDDRMGWAKWGYSSCGEWLAWRCGVSLSTAREKVRTAQALRELPETALAFREGRLSYTKVRALTRVAAVHGEGELVRYALQASAPDVEERCRQIRNVQPESVHDARRAWEARSLSAWRHTARGTLCLRVELPQEIGELVMRAIEKAMGEDEVADGGCEGSPSTFQSQQADALVAIMKTYLDGGSGETGAASADRYQVVVHVDEAALRGGVGRADAPLETIKRLACDSSVIVVTEDECGTPIKISRKQRALPAAVRRALWARDRHCRFPGCQHSRFMEPHHVLHWIHGGKHDLDNLVLLCWHHHRLLHEGGYGIRRDYQGELYFVRADGRTIPRCGYRAEDYTDDYHHDCGDGCSEPTLDNPSMEGLHAHSENPSMEGYNADENREHTSMEVREPRVAYQVTPRFASSAEPRAASCHR